MIKQILFVVQLVGCITINVQPSFQDRLSDAAISLTAQKVKYDPAYYSIKYPGGDVAANKGV